MAEFLADIEDNKDGVRIATGIGIAVDGFIALAVAALVYILWDRSNLFAVLALLGFVANAAVASVSDGLGIVLTMIANDFVTGGPEGVAAGDPATLEVGRAVGMAWFATQQIAFTALGLALLALGALLAYAPAGAVNPPRFFGWISLIAGAAAILAC